MKNNMYQTILYKLNLLLDLKLSAISLGVFLTYNLTQLSEITKFIGIVTYLCFLLRRWYLMEKKKGE